VKDLVPLTEGLSGREIERLVKEVTNRMVSGENAQIPKIVERGLDEVRDYEIRVRALTFEDFEKARLSVNPVTTAEDMRRYADWKESNEV